MVKTTGDGLLVEFPGATPALRRAIAVQREMHRLNRPTSSDDLLHATRFLAARVPRAIELERGSIIAGLRKAGVAE